MPAAANRGRLRDSLGVRCPLARDEPHDDDGCFDCFDHDFDDGFDATCVGLSLASFEASMTRLRSVTRHQI